PEKAPPLSQRINEQPGLAVEQPANRCQGHRLRQPQMVAILQMRPESLAFEQEPRLLGFNTGRTGAGEPRRLQRFQAFDDPAAAPPEATAETPAGGRAGAEGVKLAPCT